jgi:hypothetical protein
MELATTPMTERHRKYTLTPLVPTATPHSSFEAKRSGRAIPSNLAQPEPRLYPHSAGGTDGAHSLAISCLGVFPTPASECMAGLIIAGVRKPAQSEKKSVRVCLFRIGCRTGLSTRATRLSGRDRVSALACADAGGGRLASFAVCPGQFTVPNSAGASSDVMPNVQS